MLHRITNQDIVAKSIIDRSGSATKQEIIKDTGLTSLQVKRARNSLVNRGLFISKTIKRGNDKIFDDNNDTDKGHNQFLGYRMQVINNEKVKIRINELLDKF